MLRSGRLTVLATSLAAGLLLAQAAVPTAAAPAANPEAFIKDLASQALAITQKASDPEREQHFANLFENAFDLPRISRFVLGRYWLAATDQDKQDFQKLFETYVVRAYSNRFSEYYSGETIKVTGSRSEGDDAALVTTEIIRPQGGPPVKLDWRLHRTGDDYRITDVTVSGVSMALTQKQEFAAVIERSGGGVAGLNNALREKIKGITATAQQQ